MAQEKLTFEQVTALEERLIASTPPQGAIGNEALRCKLGWNEDQYWFIRDRLLQTGVLIKGRGRGGSVLRGVPIVSEADLIIPRVPQMSEGDLYDPIISTISSHWVPDHRIQDFVIDCTAHQGSRATGGKWTRPDVTLASCNRFKFVPGQQVELTTFEIKTFEGLDVTSVYEALAHRRSAHYSYVVAYVPETERLALRSLLDRLCFDADNHGVGLILLSEPDDYETWSFEVEPGRNEPDPADLDNFIRTQTGDEFKDRILGWCRTF
jgi:hypothetical protein